MCKVLQITYILYILYCTLHTSPLYFIQPSQLVVCQFSSVSGLSYPVLSRLVLSHLALSRLSLPTSMSTTLHYLTTFLLTLRYTTLKVTLYTPYVLNSTGRSCWRRSLLILSCARLKYVSQFNLPWSTPPSLLASITSALPYPAIKPSDSPPVLYPVLYPALDYAPADLGSPSFPSSDLPPLSLYSQAIATPRLSTRLNCLDLFYMFCAVL